MLTTFPSYCPRPQSGEDYLDDDRAKNVMGKKTRKMVKDNLTEAQLNNLTEKGKGAGNGGMIIKE